jgi:hypothetical protein
MGSRPHENWQIAILPFMDNQALYEAIDHRLWIDPTLAPVYDHKAEWGVFHGAGGNWHNAGGTMAALSNAPDPVWEQFHPTLGQRFRQIALPFMMCPSDPGARIESDGNPTWAVTSYAGSTGNSNNLIGTGSTAECTVYEIYNDQATMGNWYWGDFSWRSRSHSGVFSRWTATGVRLNDIQDGMSNTFAAGEVLWHCVDHRPMFWHPHMVNHGMAATTMPMNIFATCENVSVRDAIPFLACRGQITASSLAMGFRSLHPQGCNFLMCDDSVKFLLEDMDEKTYRNLGSKSDGFVIDANLF